MTKIITLLTDYGDRDFYVAALKGAIYTIAPHLSIVDVTHHIEPQNVADAAFVLRHAMSSFPKGTIHVAVVDPGVGSERRILLAKYDGQYFIAPDNGLLTWIDYEFQREETRSIENASHFAKRVSATFHGRDIMAPAAAHLANGAAPETFGPTVNAMELLPIAFRAEAVGNGFAGHVIYVDRFGTLVTNIHASQLAMEWMNRYIVQINGTTIGSIREAFHRVSRGEFVAYLGSTDFLEVAVNCGSALQRLGKECRIEVTWKGS